MPDRSRRKNNVGLVELPDEALDLMNHYARSPEWDVAVVVSVDSDSYAVRMAEVLNIPVLEAANRLSLSSTNRLVVGEKPRSLLSSIREMMSGVDVEILSVSEALDEIQHRGGSSDSAILSDEMVRPKRIEPREQDPARDSASMWEHTGRPRFDAGSLLGADFRKKLEALPLDEGEDRLLREILSLAVRATHAQTGSIMLLDKDGEHLRIVAAEGLPMDVIANTRRRVGEGVSGRVFAQGEPLIVRGPVPDSEATRNRPMLREAACVPILSETRPIGVLNVNVESEDIALDDSTLALLSRFAKEASGAILKAIDIKSISGGETKREALLRQVDKLLSLDESLPSRLRAIGDALRNSTQAELMHLFMVNPLGRGLELFTPARGLSAPVARLEALDRGVHGWVVRHGKLQIAELEDPDSGSRIANVYLPIRASHPHALLVLEAVPAGPNLREEMVPLLRDVLDQIGEFLSVEEGVDAQELLNQLNLRVTDQSEVLKSLPPTQRRRAILEFTVELLAAEAAMWIPEGSGRAVSTRPGTRSTSEILAAARSDLEVLTDWIRSKGAVAGGAVAPGWDSRAPRGPAPYVGVAHPDGDGVAIVFFSPEEEAGSPAQVPPHVLFEVLLHVVGFMPPAEDREGQGGHGVFIAK